MIRFLEREVSERLMFHIKGFYLSRKRGTVIWFSWRASGLLGQL